MFISIFMSFLFVSFIISDLQNIIKAFTLNSYFICMIITRQLYK